MCGIVGVAGKIGPKEEKYLLRTWFADGIRGWDSSGIANVYDTFTDDPSVVVAKELGGPEEIIENYHQKALNYDGSLVGTPDVVIAHNRKATMGSITTETAHPFEYGDVVGVHNGTLQYWSDLEKPELGCTDSMAIYNHIAIHGIEDCWKSFYGAAALVWYDKSNNTLNFIRNSQRPLCYAVSEDGETIFWSSEESILKYGLDATGIKTKVFDAYITGSKGEKIDVKSKILSFSVNKHYSYEMTGGVLEAEVRELKNFPKPVTTPVSKVVSGKTHTVFGQAKGEKTMWYKNGWAKSLEKGDKKFRGTFWTVSHVDDFYEHALIFKSLKENLYSRVVYKDTNLFDRHKLLMDQHQRSPKNTHVWKLTSRPRLASIDAPVDFVVDSAHMEYAYLRLNDTVPGLTHPGPHGNKVSSRRWKELIRGDDIEGCCSGCGNPVNEEAPEDYQWVGSKAIVCPDCKDNDPVIDALMSLEGMY